MRSIAVVLLALTACAAPPKPVEEMTKEERDAYVSVQKARAENVREVIQSKIAEKKASGEWDDAKVRLAVDAIDLTFTIVELAAAYEAQDGSVEAWAELTKAQDRLTTKLLILGLDRL